VFLGCVIDDRPQRREVFVAGSAAMWELGQPEVLTAILEKLG
jgi:hypothetical protein